MTEAVRGNAGGSGQTGQTTVGTGRRKLTPSEAGYRKGGGVPGLQCGDCINFEAGQCRIIDIPAINPGDYCDEFETNPQGRVTMGEVSGPATMKAEGLAVSGPLRRVVPIVAVSQMWITRVGEDRQTGVKHWFSTASGVDRDLYNERMSIELFKDFIKRAEGRDKVPPPFSSKAWNGGLPYLGVAHYLDLDGAGIAGPTRQIYVDGTVFKARGDFNETPVGIAAYNAIKRDIDDDLPFEQRTRISIAFIDWAHDHEGQGMFERRSMIERCDMCERGLGEKVYKAGHLVHLALTRRPAYPSTSIELEE